MFGGGVLDNGGASLSFQCGKGVWLTKFRERMEIGLSVSMERDPGGGLR